VVTYGASGLGTDGKGSSSRVYGGGVDMDNMMNEWWRRPSTEGRPDYSSSESTEKGLGLDKTNQQKSIYLSKICDNEINRSGVSIEIAPEQ